ncbi:hypothetical protein [Tabrizicola piscis]|jgi:hypothetical protein|uniref:hypothetical protein n=1 Tax=Tabrizicola piscis TaxID=2494374 RepID=UPI001C20C402|nr:hypothetical protein [Tabrizicola piscis]
MQTTKSSTITKFLAGTAAVLTLSAVVTLGSQILYPNASTAFAQTEGGEGGGKGGQGQGGQGQGGQGEGGQGKGGEGAGQGGPGEDSDGKGPKAGSAGNTGGKPVWAQEGIPVVELGRLNVARSPDSVLARAYAEALASLTPEMIEFYNLTTAEMIDELSFNFDNVAYIDSPLQNLALLKDALDGTSALTALGVTTDPDTLMATFLAVAADKDGEGITAATVEAVSTILGTPITGDDAVAVAIEAESIRLAVVVGHDS